MNAWLLDHPVDSPDNPLELLLLDEHTIEEDFGWVFFYTSKLYYETGDFRYALAGNAPMIVDRRDGSIHITGTAYPTSYFIEEYRRQRPM